MEITGETLEIDSSSKLKVKNVPQLEPYFKMIKMGVPLEAVKLKMARENFNPDLLDDPEADFAE